MEITKMECKKNMRTLFIYSICVGAMILLCMLLFPAMKNESKQLDQMYASMGNFSAALGLNQISITNAMGFFAIECGTILGLGGILYCGILGIQILVSEEQYHTVEFLYVHPKTRKRILIEKILAMCICIVGFYGINFLVAWISFLMIGESFVMSKLVLIFLMQFLLGIEVAGICFGISCFFHSGKLSVGIGIGFLFYCLDLYANMQKEDTFIRFFTPFSYANPVVVLSKSGIEVKYVIVGIIQLFMMLGIGSYYFQKKDFSS